MRPTLLLLPGMMLDERVFRGQLSRLAKSVDAVVGDISTGNTVEEIARNVLEKAPPRFAVAGLSMGGIIGFEIWRRAPNRVTHLALLDTTPHADRADRSRQRLEQVTAVGQGHLREVMMTHLIPHYLADKNRANQALLESILDMGLSLGPEVFRRQSTALSCRPNSLPILSTINCPALVMCGREDALCTVDVHQMMANIMPRADLVVLAECGHLSSLEEPTAVSFALEHLLERSA
jgi:pimeloyl-ACP methyl ester carboxylesterase